MMYMSGIPIRQSEWFTDTSLALDCGSPEPLAVFKAEDDRGGGGGMPSDSKLSMSFIAFCISESCSRRSGTGLSTASG
jgi:hypothetical protein